MQVCKFSKICMFDLINSFLNHVLPSIPPSCLLPLVCAGICILPPIGLPVSAQSEGNADRTSQIMSARSDKSGWYAALPLAVGRDLGAVRLEGTVSLFGVPAVLGSVYYDFSPEARFSPNVSGSLGFGNYADTSFFIAGVSGGVSYAFHESWDGTIDLRALGIFAQVEGLSSGFGFGFAPGLRLRYRF